MGLCHEFGTQIHDGCEHPMKAGATACSCPECGVSCQGLFEGCPDVWARGPQPVTIVAGRASAESPSPFAAAVAAGTSPFGESDPLPSATPLVAPGLGDSRSGSRSDSPFSPLPGGDSPFGSAPSGPALPRGRNGRQANRGPRSKGPRLAAAPNPGGGETRADVVDWFDNAFESLRQELRSLSTGMTQQEAMVAELLDTRQGELRLVLVAEALPDLVAEAVRQAMADHLAGITESFDVALGNFRQEIKRMKKAGDAAIEEIHQSVGKTLAGVGSALETQTAELREADASRSRAIKAAVTRQVGPLVTALEESTARHDAAIALLARKMDRMSAAVEKSVGARPARPPKPVAKSPAGVAAGPDGTPAPTRATKAKAATAES